MSFGRLGALGRGFGRMGGSTGSVSTGNFLLLVDGASFLLLVNGTDKLVITNTAPTNQLLADVGSPILADVGSPILVQ